MPRTHTHTNISIAIYTPQYEYSVHCTIVGMQGKWTYNYCSVTYISLPRRVQSFPQTQFSVPIFTRTSYYRHMEVSMGGEGTAINLPVSWNTPSGTFFFSTSKVSSSDCTVSRQGKLNVDQTRNWKRSSTQSRVRASSCSTWLWQAEQQRRALLQLK